MVEGRDPHGRCTGDVRLRGLRRAGMVMVEVLTLHHNELPPDGIVEAGVSNWTCSRDTTEACADSSNVYTDKVGSKRRCSFAGENDRVAARAQPKDRIRPWASWCMAQINPHCF